jgi:hypothetical protein
MSAVCGTAFVAAMAGTFAIWASEGPESAPTEENPLAMLLLWILLLATLGSLTAFGMALAARSGHERWAWLWLPLSLFPGILVFFVLGEAFLWE